MIFYCNNSVIICDQQLPTNEKVTITKGSPMSTKKVSHGVVVVVGGRGCQKLNDSSPSQSAD